jgi:hypothetical protein
MHSWRFAELSAIIAIVFCVSACQPTIDLSGIYAPNDYPWSGWPKIEINTFFPGPLFIGTFTIYILFEYTEILIGGTINSQNEIAFMPHNDDPPISGLCLCQGFDDGSSIFTGSGQIADDGLGDRLACSTYLGQSLDPPGELFRIDW